LFTGENTYAHCCVDHLWFTTTSAERKTGLPGKVRSTQEIMSSLLDSDGEANHHLPRAEAVHFTAGEELPVPPYTMGRLAASRRPGYLELPEGDLAFARIRTELASINCRLVSLTDDWFEVRPERKVEVSVQGVKSVVTYPTAERAASAVGLTKAAVETAAATGRSLDGSTFRYVQSYTNPVFNTLAALEETSCVPGQYKTASVADRTEFLRGVMDEAGETYNNKPTIRTNLKKLNSDIAELVWSLGGTFSRTVKSYGDGTGRDRTVYDIFVETPFYPFYVNRSAEGYVPPEKMQGVPVSSVVLLGEMECKCISVDSDDHLYLTNHYLVTHNTFEEKVHPYMLPIFDCIEQCVGKDSVQAETIKKCVEVAPLAYMRGRTLSNAICILDEAQNCTRNQIKLFLSRLGTSSKMIVTGDPKQSDLRGGYQALTQTARLLEPVDGIGIVTLKNDAIVRHPLVGKVLDALEAEEGRNE
jgi:hypothetical protein